MKAKQDYDELRSKVQTGKNPNARLDIFCAGVAGLLEAHKEDAEYIGDFGVSLRTNNSEWNKTIFATV